MLPPRAVGRVLDFLSWEGDPVPLICSVGQQGSSVFHPTYCCGAGLAFAGSWVVDCAGRGAGPEVGSPVASCAACSPLLLGLCPGSQPATSYSEAGGAVSLVPCITSLAEEVPAWPSHQVRTGDPGPALEACGLGKRWEGGMEMGQAVGCDAQF